MKEEINKEQLILEAAESEFLENGFNNAKTTVIAKKAGVTHAMLHYYFRTKKNLFQMVFKKKILMVANSFGEKYKASTSFEEAIRNFIEFHFDFIGRNPKLVSFVYNEIVSNKRNRDMLIEKVAPHLAEIFSHINKLIESESAKGTIAPIKTLDLILNIVSINVVTFMAHSIMFEFMDKQGMDHSKSFLKERKESNVQFILNALRK